jgi:hypothetical protein
MSEIDRCIQLIGCKYRFWSRCLKITYITQTEDYLPETELKVTVSISSTFCVKKRTEWTLYSSAVTSEADGDLNL